jgi:hypothetical protein
MHTRQRRVHHSNTYYSPFDSAALPRTTAACSQWEGCWMRGPIMRTQPIHLHQTPVPSVYNLAQATRPQRDAPPSLKTINHYRAQWQLPLELVPSHSAATVGSVLTLWACSRIHPSVTSKDRIAYSICPIRVEPKVRYFNTISFIKVRTWSLIESVILIVVLIGILCKLEVR